MNRLAVNDMVASVLEADYDDDSLIKDVTELPADYKGEFRQIDGDFGDPWTYGGTWFNDFSRGLIHFRGIEDEGQEIDPDDVIPPARMITKIKAQVHDPWLDTDEAKEDPEFHARHTRSEENEIDRLIGHYQVARAEFLNNRVQYEFFGTTVPEKLSKVDDDHAREAFNRNGYEGDFDTIPTEIKLCILIQEWSPRDLLRDFTMDRQHASAYLGVNL